MPVSTSAPTLISSKGELQAFISSIRPSSTLYLDLEGNSLSRHGTICIVTILVYPQGAVNLIDVSTLGESSFTTEASDSRSLKSILEDPSITKCLWDVRRDADALWGLYRVHLAGVIDIQLLENASRAGDKTYLSGLDNAVQRDLNLGSIERYRWNTLKSQIKRLMPTDIFAVRPLGPETIQYCANDVVHLPDLHAVYLRRITNDWLAKAKEQSSRRVDEARSVSCSPSSAERALGPWGRGTDRGIVSFGGLLEELDNQTVEDFERDFFGDDVDWDYDDGWPESCRDIIDDADYEYYYSD
ncbi:hypothetical protein AAE478_006208 [Parahypoxylon ruwenzoriense]